MFDSNPVVDTGAEDSTSDPGFRPASPATLTLTPSGLSWIINSGGGFSAKSVTVTNTGDMPSGALTSAVSVGASSFRITVNNCSALDSGQSCTLQLIPTGSAAGSYSGSFDVSGVSVPRTVSGSLSAQICGTGYTAGPGSCVPNNCTAGTLSGYPVPAINHGASAGVTKTTTITNGSQVWTATASCSAGTVTLSGESAATTCASGYTWNGSACAPVGPSCGNFTPQRFCTGSRIASVGLQGNRLYRAGEESLWLADVGGKCRVWCAQYSNVSCCALVLTTSGIFPCAAYTGNIYSYQYAYATTCIR
jgi:hypothetical protein